MKLGIFGVGRSGTTALYVGIQSLILMSQQEKYDYCYEPYLWSHQVFNAPYDMVQNKFGLTSSISIDGIYAHCKTPLFLENSVPEHDQFLSEVFGDSENFLLKSIRGCGRLNLYLEHFPDLKIVYIIRNPLDTINSVINLFSFYGDEFHPSDKNRFIDEVSIKLGFDIPQYEDLDEVGWSFLWWKHMNLEALRIIQQYPERVLFLTYEAFCKDPVTSLKSIADFSEIPFSAELPPSLQKPVGPYTSRVNLGLKEIHFIRGVDSNYWQNLVPLSQVPLGVSVTELREQVYQRYLERATNAESSSRTPTVPTDWTGVKLRQEISKLRNACQHTNEHSLSYFDLKERYTALKAAYDEASIKVERSAAFRKKCKKEQRNLLNEINLMHQSYGTLLNHQPNALEQARESINYVIENSRPLKITSPFTQLKSSLVDIASQLEVAAYPANIACVITSYNNAPYLREAVYSVLAQTIPIKEIIIADDGSTDGSHEIINSLANEFNNIRPIFRETNVGPGLNRHLAMIESDCEFITQLDGDDTLYHLKIAREFEIVRRNRNSIAYSDFVLDEPSNGFTTLYTKYFSKISRKRRILSILMPERPLPHNMLYAKKLYVEVGGYDTSALMYEDWSLKMRLAASGVKWIHVPVKGLIYRRHGSGLSSSKPFVHLFWRFYIIGKNFDWLYEKVGCRKILAALMMFVGTIKCSELYNDLNNTLKLLLNYLNKTECVEEAAGCLNIALMNLVKSKALSRDSEKSYSAIEKFTNDLRGQLESIQISDNL